MGDAWIKGGRAGRAGLSGEDKLRPHRNYDERWMERAVHGLYESTVDEPVPKDMLDLVTRIQKHTSPDAERAHRWRAKAEEIRTAAESMDSESARDTLLRLAHDYDALAESLELLILERPRRDRNAG
jgi:hypothetical protein